MPLFLKQAKTIYLHFIMDYNTTLKLHFYIKKVKGLSELFESLGLGEFTTQIFCEGKYCYTLQGI